MLVRLEQVASGCSQIVVGRERKKISARPPNDTGNIYKYVQFVNKINDVMIYVLKQLVKINLLICVK